MFASTTSLARWPVLWPLSSDEDTWLWTRREAFCEPNGEPQSCLRCKQTPEENACLFSGLIPSQTQLNGGNKNREQVRTMIKERKKEKRKRKNGLNVSSKFSLNIYVSSFRDESFNAADIRIMNYLNLYSAD